MTNPQTSATAISVTAPQIVLNPGSSGYIMYAYSSYQWINPPDSNCPMASAQIGGLDGIGFAFNKAVTNKGVSFSACNLYNKCASTGWLESNNGYGAGWALQDWGYAGLYGYSPTYRGTLTYVFTSNPNKCLQAYSKYGHLWSSTSLSGVSVGIWSLGMLWNTSSNQWQKSSQAGSYKC